MSSYRPQPFEASDLLLGLNFSKVLSSLVALNKVTAGWLKYVDRVCASHMRREQPVFMKELQSSVWGLTADTSSVLFMLCRICLDIGVGSDSVCARHSSAHRIKSFESLSSQASLGRSSKLLQNQFRSLVRFAHNEASVFKN